MISRSSRHRTLVRIVTLVAMAAVLAPVAMPLCAMAGEMPHEQSMPCHPPAPEDVPCHPADDDPAYPAERVCCAPTLEMLHEEAISQDRPEAHLLYVLPLVLIRPSSDVAAADLLPNVADISPPRSSVGLSILFRSLLN